MVYLITGKADSGKTHYADALMKELRAEGIKVKWLDGDRFRDQTDNHDFTVAGRRRNLNDAAKMAQGYEEEGYFVLVSFIAPMKVWRDEMRAYWEKSRVIYMPGGTLWKGTVYEQPRDEELNIVEN